MSYKSLCSGLKQIYAGKSNDILANLIFNYFSKGMKNYEVTFSSFIYHFIAEIDLDSTRLNHLVFKMLDEDKDGELQILDLMRLYVNLPASSPFNEEIRLILRYYLENCVRPSREFRRKIDFNFHLFKSLIPMSKLALEFKDKFY